MHLDPKHEKTFDDYCEHFGTGQCECKFCDRISLDLLEAFTNAQNIVNECVEQRFVSDWEIGVCTIINHALRENLAFQQNRNIKEEQTMFGDWDQGYEEGKAEGDAAGSERGHDYGYEKGYNDGYYVGVEAGKGDVEEA